MSLVLGALGGFEKPRSGMGETNQKAWLDQDLQREQSDNCATARPLRWRSSRTT